MEAKIKLKFVYLVMTIANTVIHTELRASTTLPILIRFNKT